MSINMPKKHIEIAQKTYDEIAQRIAWNCPKPIPNVKYCYFSVVFCMIWNLWGLT
jgi:hypothetical protein